jgi:P-type E1-E2 ATPase
MTIVFFGWEREVQGLLIFGDSLKDASRKTVQELQKRGIEVWLVSGDAEGTTRAVAGKLGIEWFSGQAVPKDKVEIIKALQKKGHRVGMIGDGINDAAALVQADVGLTLGTSLNVSREASDITLITGDPARITEVFDLSALTVRIIRQNLLFAFFYNGLALPLAVAGLLNPLVAVFAMFASSFCVIGNSFRISKGNSLPRPSLISCPEPS